MAAVRDIRLVCTDRVDHDHTPPRFETTKAKYARLTLRLRVAVKQPKWPARLAKGAASF
jgi:hypothetical protein